VKCISGILAGESPLDKSSPTVDLAISGARFGRQSGEVRKAAFAQALFAQALAGEQPGLNFRLIESTAVLWSVVDREVSITIRQYQERL